MKTKTKYAFEGKFSRFLFATFDSLNCISNSEPRYRCDLRRIFQSLDVMAKSENESFQQKSKHLKAEEAHNLPKQTFIINLRDLQQTITYSDAI